MNGGNRIDAASSGLWSVRVRAGDLVSRRGAWAHGARYREASTLGKRPLVVAALEVLFCARGQRKALSFMESDNQDTGAEGRWRRSGVSFRRRLALSAFECVHTLAITYRCHVGPWSLRVWCCSTPWGSARR